MKCIIPNYGVGMNTAERQVARAAGRDMTKARGTTRIPLPPRGPMAQSGPNGVLLNWAAPEGFSGDIVGWHIYKDNENSLFATVSNPNTTQYFIAASSGSTPPVTNFWIASINALGIESPLVPVQGSAAVQAGAPSVPSTPPTSQIPATVPPGQGGLPPWRIY